MDNAHWAAISEAMEFDTDIVIAGGGLNGTTLAVALASSGLDVTLVEPIAENTRKIEGFDGRSYALSVASLNVLKALGIFGSIEENAQPILDIRVSDGRPGEGPSPLMLHFDHAEIEEGPMGALVEDRHLRPALLKAVEEAGVRQVTGDHVIGQTVAGSSVTAHLTNGKTKKARLLVGCDGKTSGVAERAGIRKIGWRYGQTGLVCAIEHEKPHEGTAYQFFMPSGPLAILPLVGKRSSIVWTESDARAGEIMAMGDTEYLSVLRPRFGDFLGDISLTGKRFAYPLELSIADRFVEDRVALLGDAAHVVHPLAGQGLNAGLKDVAALAEVLIDARRRGEDIGRADVLLRYQRWRRFDTASLALATDSFNRLFSNDNSLVRLVRDIGMGAVNALPALRRTFIREAAGLTGDTPRLARGLPL